MPRLIRHRTTSRASLLVKAAAAAAYAVIGAALVLTRFIGLGHGYWHDEIVTAEFIRAGPADILAGPNASLNNHKLFSILAWTTNALVDSEISTRVWSAAPFVLGAVVVAIWLHVRVGALSGILALFFATVSPLLLDITRQARGYGLAFLAMAVLVVAALEAERSRTTWWLAAFCAAGVAGTWTLPQFALPFFATGAVLLVYGALRRRVVVGLAISVVAILAWYGPHLTELGAAREQTGGVQIDTIELVTAPIDQVVLPAFLWIDGHLLIADLVWLPLVLALALLLGSSPLVRSWRQVSLLGAGVVATIVAVWLTSVYVVPRYLSFLLVPMFILLASGTASVLMRLPRRPAIVRTLVATTMLALLTAGFVVTAPDVVRLPREAHKEAAAVVERLAPQDAPVLVYAHHPDNVGFYLDRPSEGLEPEEVISRVCDGERPVVYVMQPFVIPPVDVPCLREPGVLHERVRQYTRGAAIDVWLLPART